MRPTHSPFRWGFTIFLYSHFVLSIPATRDNMIIGNSNTESGRPVRIRLLADSGAVVAANDCFVTLEALF